MMMQTSSGLDLFQPVVLPEKRAHSRQTKKPSVRTDEKVPRGSNRVTEDRTYFSTENTERLKLKVYRKHIGSYIFFNSVYRKNAPMSK